ncbi:MAG: hypothetical protein UX04_C0006G0017 [Microgenomates group bacterium GW2011_GWF2_45_18]|nr:MAG: hypothetical protein UW18_C0006G0017 [Microgenomates group bacterium GW2011_GWF1_44_10]KKU01482.1 MAG: hypothetical protein UX04_C0006G0017 [Microgenomates group bacterium GW2011_GWF2_45_18]HAU99391.1 hypothetical protein [Candidatus Paceibacterota bacterium]HAX01604.1 hypothetical protein [Candidatus Paceibacterota bacterium]
MPEDFGMYDWGDEGDSNAQPEGNERDFHEPIWRRIAFALIEKLNKEYAPLTLSLDDVLAYSRRTPSGEASIQRKLESLPLDPQELVRETSMTFLNELFSDTERQKQSLVMLDIDQAFQNITSLAVPELERIALATIQDVPYSPPKENETHFPFARPSSKFIYQHAESIFANDEEVPSRDVPLHVHEFAQSRGQIGYFEHKVVLIFQHADVKYMFMLHSLEKRLAFAKIVAQDEQDVHEMFSYVYHEQCKIYAQKLAQEFDSVYQFHEQRLEHLELRAFEQVKDLYFEHVRNSRSEHIVWVYDTEHVTFTRVSLAITRENPNDPMDVLRFSFLIEGKMHKVFLSRREKIGDIDSAVFIYFPGGDFDSKHVNTSEALSFIKSFFSSQNPYTVPKLAEIFQEERVKDSNQDTAQKIEGRMQEYFDGMRKETSFFDFVQELSADAISAQSQRMHVLASSQEDPRTRLFESYQQLRTACMQNVLADVQGKISDNHLIDADFYKTDLVRRPTPILEHVEYLFQSFPSLDHLLHHVLAIQFGHAISDMYLFQLAQRYCDTWDQKKQHA